MGCGNCGSGANGAPSGCKGNGGCSTGGCNRLNVYDWLNALPLHDNAKPYAVVEVSFNKGSRKEFFRNNTHYILEKGDWFAVEGVGGYDVGQVSLTGELVKLQLKKYGVRDADVTKRVLHPATDEEIDMRIRQKEREPEMLIRSRAIAKTLNLDMKLCEVEIQADSKKGTFFYTADQRVDFRELIRVFATDFKMKVEMKQIGARQESGKVGGIGSCGRELCCSTWLTDFKSVNTTAARYQNLSINQTKLSGQCGRLKCCLNYELDTYMDALSVFPDHAEHIETVKGIAHLQKKDIFKNVMWYSYSDNNKQYPLSIERVKEIQKLNKAGQKADELHPIELETRDSKAGIKADMGFVNDVGQITLKALEKGNKKKKSGGSGKAPDTRANQQGNRPNQDRKPQDGKPQQGQNGPRPPRENKPGQQTGNQQGNRPQQNNNRKQNNRPNPNANPDQPQAADGAVSANPAEGQATTPRPQQQQGNRQQRQNNGPRPQRNDRPQGDRPPRPERPQGEKPQGDAAQSVAPQEGGNRPQGDRPQGDRPQGNRPNRNNRNRPNRGPRPEGGGDAAGPRPEPAA